MTSSLVINNIELSDGLATQPLIEVKQYHQEH